MSLVLELPAEVEARIRADASRTGKSANAYAVELVERAMQLDGKSSIMDPREIMRLSIEDRRRILAMGAEAVADLYNEDLARPVADRELTAFTALDGDPLHEYGNPS